MDPKRFAKRIQRRLWLLESENCYRVGPDSWYQSQLSVAAAWAERAEWELEIALNILLGRIHSDLFRFYHANRGFVESYFSQRSTKQLASTTLTSFSESVVLHLPQG